MMSDPYEIREGINSQNIMSGLMSKEDILTNIAEADKRLISFVNSDLKKQSTLRFVCAFYEEMVKQSLGKFAKQIGSASFLISEEFWEDEKRAERIIKNTVLSLKKSYQFFKEEIGEDADKIFEDNVRLLRLAF
jgi:hypothetical protein